jgi:hypothetical protein
MFFYLKYLSIKNTYISRFFLFLTLIYQKNLKTFKKTNLICFKGNNNLKKKNTNLRSHNIMDESN